ncbi:hypothetical protein [Legionella micdadei]|uniref:Uncharacterized protein n=1 Tax=Legionella micdadei TaxID=451 RepID=A0A098GG69_LEGMI|nr:hypothetical protein [Legionella micdadei]KTD27507.1 hypothetical protein Lmic_2136 [Legionella micdadei]CEG60982.1 protein of unknown function [Legionella micdadei]SCY69974.1 hypothetical protein SAMN02982997_02553 [Legionella micdadei]
MTVMIRNERKFYVSQYNPYSSEWAAVCENYDAEFIDDSWVSSYAIGIGNTPDEAIDDLLNQESN